MTEKNVKICNYTDYDNDVIIVILMMMMMINGEGILIINDLGSVN